MNEGIAISPQLRIRMSFYNRLNYSLGNEDWSVEEQALRINPNDKVVCVTASGDRPLHLLMTECAEIISIDMNRIQNFLLELKLAALIHLDYEPYLAFLGFKETSHRYSMFKQLKSYLSNDAFQYWEQNKKMIKRGIIYQGKVERLTYYASFLFRSLKRKHIKKLFSFNDIDAQRQFIASRWDTPLWRKIFEFSLNPNVSKILINDPGIISYVDDSITPGKYLYQRKLNYLNNYLAKHSALLQLLFTGKVSPDAYFPYLTFEGYNKIRKDVGRLKHYTVDVIEYINNTDYNEFDCFSLSDIASYMSQENFTRLLKGIYQAAKPNARFCLRKLMCNHTIPENISHHFKRDKLLEQKLEKEDSNFVYRFLVGEIIK